LDALRDDILGLLFAEFPRKMTPNLFIRCASHRESRENPRVFRGMTSALFAFVHLISQRPRWMKRRAEYEIGSNVFGDGGLCSSGFGWVRGKCPG
jgi:hypothetical protein